MRFLSGIILLALLAVAPAVAARDLVVIVNPASGVEHLSQDEAINIFMGRSRKLPSGIAAFPIDIGSKTAEREAFYRLLVNKEPAEIDAYWARLVFSGEASPPLQVPDGKTAMQLVSGNRGAIAYVDRALVDSHVKVVLELDIR